MTAWHEDATTTPETCEVAALCHSGTDFVLCVVVGSDADLAEFVELLRKRLAHGG